jgi:hypothetical protein
VPHIKFYSTNGLDTPQVGSDFNMDLSWVALKVVVRYDGTGDS